MVVFHVHGLQISPRHLLFLLLVLLPVLCVGGVVECFLLGDPMLVINLPISALVGHPVGRQGCLESLPGQIQQIIILGQPHAQGIDGILFDLAICRFVRIINLLDHGLGLLFLVLLLVELVGLRGELAVGVEFIVVHGWVIGFII